MKRYQLSDFKGGWFVGDFDPSILRTTGGEVAIKSYNPGDSEPAHVHRGSTEITCVVMGQVYMNEMKLCPGDMVEIAPGEAVSFRAVTTALTVVVKVPSVPGDKEVLEVGA